MIGKLLVSDISILNDNLFGKSVIILTEYSQQGWVGFILNKPTKYKINDIIDINCNFNVYQGGPVENDKLFYIHKVPHLLDGSIKIGNGLFWGGNFEQLKLLLSNNKINNDDIRFFIGYSGWGVNQLETEIKENSWVIVKNNYDNILIENPNNLWKREMLKLSDNYKIWANTPNDIQMN